MNTVIGVFDDYDAAGRAVRSLLDEELAPAPNISVIARYAVRRAHTRNVELEHDLEEDPGPDAVVTGAGIGGLVVGSFGGLLGLLAGVGAVALPGIGTAVAAGPLLAALAGTTVGAVTGAVGGALVGELARLGVPELDAQFYAEAVRRGGTVIVVRVHDDSADRVAYVMTRHGALDVDEHRASFRTTDVTEATPDATPYTADELFHPYGHAGARP